MKTKKTMTCSDNSLSMYLRDVNKVKLISRDEETQLAIRAANGDIAARNKIVNANLRFVINVAKRYQNHGIELEDLVSEGNIGLITAIERFDVSKGYHFISYAVWWIRQAILRYICEKSRMIRLPLNRVSELMRIEYTRKMILGNKSEEEEIAEVAEILKMSPLLVRELAAISRDMVSLDAAVNTYDPDGALFGDFVEDTRYESPENTVVYSGMKKDIDDALSTLSLKEAEVIRRRFGLNGGTGKSLREVGDELHLTKERIRQIEKRAIGHLQHPKRTMRLEGYVA
ncbi:MAG: RNA polymerase sigma factor RpoD/SigA [Treponema sp.]|jgi:RNA polymerase primary sigma factor|nr:RNA polymerase sigma factor RpoD/SigA [Treponema sp.]